MRRNLAARIGVWSAHHRKTAIIGWLLFVVLAAVVGGVSGMAEMSRPRTGTGDSARAEKILDDAGLDQPGRRDGHGAQQDGRTAGGTRPRVAWPIEQDGRGDRVEPPLASKNGREALIRFQMKGDPKTAADRVQPVLDAVRDTEQGRTRTSTIDQFGEASADKWLGDMLADDFAEGGVDRRAARAGHSAGRLRGAGGRAAAGRARDDGVHRRQRAARASSAISCTWSTRPAP